MLAAATVLQPLLSPLFRRERPWRAVIATFLAALVVFTSAAPVWGSVLANDRAALTSGAPVNETPDEADRDGNCLLCHGSHCHHHADRPAPCSVTASVVTQAAALHLGRTRRLASVPTPPLLKPPRD